MDREGLTPLFNRLSWLDKWKLKCAAGAVFVTGFIRDDTKAHPGRFPLYMAYLALLSACATLSPIPGTTEGVFLLTLAALRKSNSEFGRQMEARLKETFNREALVVAHAAFVEPHKTREGRLRIRTGALAAHTARQTLKDVWNAAQSACAGLKRFLFPPAGNGPKPHIP